MFSNYIRSKKIETRILVLKILLITPFNKLNNIKSDRHLSEIVNHYFPAIYRDSLTTKNGSAYTSMGKKLKIKKYLQNVSTYFSSWKLHICLEIISVNGQLHLLHLIFLMYQLIFLCTIAHNLSESEYRILTHSLLWCSQYWNLWKR